MRTSLLTGVITLFALLPMTGCETKHAEHGDDDGHIETGDENHASLAGHPAETIEMHHDGNDEVGVAPEFITMAGITLAKARTGRIGKGIDVAGEIGFNEDLLVCMRPRFSGIVKEIRCSVGDHVRAGDVITTIESDENLAPYSLRSPISGCIIEKNVMAGMHVSDEILCRVADLSTVWVNLSVYPDDVHLVKIGRKVVIRSLNRTHVAEGTVRYIAPVVNPQTRSIAVRVVLGNAGAIWRPGSFVTAHIDTGDGEEGIIVDKDAVQLLGNRLVVFVQHEPGRFRPVAVTVAESDSANIRIVNGLEAGTEYVNSGAFELKAEIVTGSMGAHAGHGH